MKFIYSLDHHVFLSAPGKTEINSSAVTSDSKNTETCDKVFIPFKPSIGNINIHNIAYPSDSSKLLNKFKADLSSIFADRDLHDNFRNWLLTNDHIPQGTLSRCTDFNSILLELEKQDLLGIFVTYPGFDSRKISDIANSYNLIFQSPCGVCLRGYFEIT